MCQLSWNDAAEFLKGVSVVIASGVAIWGINSWRREHVGKKRLDTAEDMLMLFYQARDAMHGIRSPGAFTSEANERKRPAGESDEDARIRDMAYIPGARVRREAELFGKLKTLRYRAMAQFGKEFGKPFDDFDAKVREVQAAALVLARLWRNLGAPEVQQSNLKTQRNLESAIWEGADAYGNPDRIAAEIDLIVAQVEKLARPHIDRFL